VKNIRNSIVRRFNLDDDCSFILKYSSKNKFIDEEGLYIIENGGLKAGILKYRRKLYEM